MWYTNSSKKRGVCAESTTLWKKFGTNISPWIAGTVDYPAGFHCSYCTSPEGMRVKLISAINADFPRWGDYPEKCQIPFLKLAIATGTTINEKGVSKPTTIKNSMRQIILWKTKQNIPICWRILISITLITQNVSHRKIYPI